MPRHSTSIDGLCAMTSPVAYYKEVSLYRGPEMMCKCFTCLEWGDCRCCTADPSPNRCHPCCGRLLHICRAPLPDPAWRTTAGPLCRSGHRAPAVLCPVRTSTFAQLLILAHARTCTFSKHACGVGRRDERRAEGCWLTSVCEVSLSGTVESMALLKARAAGRQRDAVIVAVRCHSRLDL